MNKIENYHTALLSSMKHFSIFKSFFCFFGMKKTKKTAKSRIDIKVSSIEFPETQHVNLYKFYTAAPACVNVQFLFSLEVPHTA